MSKPKKLAKERLAAAKAEETIASVSAQIEKASAGSAEVISARQRELSVAEQRLNEIRSIEDGIHVSALQIIDDTMHAPKIEEDAEGPSEEEIAKYGKERAGERFRTARYGLMNAKEAPVFIKVATQIAAGITKARATEKQAPRSLNVAFVQMSAPLPEFPEVIVERNK